MFQWSNQSLTPTLQSPVRLIRQWGWVVMEITEKSSCYHSTLHSQNPHILNDSSVHIKESTDKSEPLPGIEEENLLFLLWHQVELQVLSKTYTVSFLISNGTWEAGLRVNICQRTSSPGLQPKSEHWPPCSQRFAEFDFSNWMRKWDRKKHIWTDVLEIRK